MAWNPQKCREVSERMEWSELPRWPRRRPETHKGDYGRVLVAGGCAGMTGAVVLAARGALRGGAGLVYAAVPASCWQVVAAADPCYLTIRTAEDRAGGWSDEAVGQLEAHRGAMDVVALGPGMGRGSGVDAVVTRLFDDWELPLVCDADGLNALARRGTWHRPAGPRVLTPHPGEFARLAPDLTPDRAGAAELARRAGATVVLKGHRTVVTDGRRIYVNATGNPGMATGGSGDVLTGLIAACIGQGIAPFDAALIGVRLHGRAGDLAAQRVGQVSLVATDLLHALPEAISEYQQATGEW